MFASNYILWIALLTSLASYLLVRLVKACRESVKIRTCTKKKKQFFTIGTLDYKGNTDDENSGKDVAFVHVEGGTPEVNSIGYVELNDERGYVCLLEGSATDDGGKSYYIPYGYVDEDGYVYDINSDDEKEQIGYLAKPSNPYVPTIKGERSWKNLWTTAVLNAYLGNPEDARLAAEKKQQKNHQKQKKTVRKEVSNQNDDEEKKQEEANNIVRANSLIIVDSNPTADAEKEDESDEVEECSAEINEVPEEIAAEETEQSETLRNDAGQEGNQLENEGESEDKQKNPLSEEDKSSLDQEDTETEPKTETKRSVKAKEAILVGNVKRTGFHYGEASIIPSEARAGAFAIMYYKHNKEDHSIYYKNTPYQWLDTALAASIVYCFLYMVLFVVNVEAFRVPMFGRNISGMLLLTAFYFIIWAVVRQYKIYRQESSSSIVPFLNLMNKSIGIRMTDRMIILVGGLIISMCYGFYEFENYLALNPIASFVSSTILNFGHYDFDFMPLVNAIVLGVTFNRLQRRVPRPWTIGNKEKEEEEIDGIRNPSGNIDVTYDWDLDSFYKSTLHGQITLHFDKEDIEKKRLLNPYYDRKYNEVNAAGIVKMFNAYKSDSKQYARLRYLAYYIEDISRRNHLENLDRLQFALDFVQEPNITYRNDRECKSLDFAIKYVRYPDETLFDKEGDYDCKAFLAAMLFYEMHYNVLYLYSSELKNAAIAVDFDNHDEWLMCFSEDMREKVVCKHNNHNYLYCEVSSDDFRIGKIGDGCDIQNYDMKIEFRHEEENVVTSDSNDEDFASADTTDISYAWTLDSLLGNKLDGKITLHFEGEDIDILRKRNKFRNYGTSGNTSYENNVRWMFDYLVSKRNKMRNVKQVAKYVNAQIKKAGLNELDKLQFAIDFVQEPNIKYCVDEESDSINNAQEYMRFPDETLYDREGDCDCKTFLAALLYHSLGYNVLFLLSSEYKHAALAIECSDELKALFPSDVTLDEKVIKNYNGSDYVFCETTADGNKIGEITKEQTIAGFETVVELKYKNDL